MKSLSLVKPLVLIMVGKPGAGKSFFARQFSDTFGAPVVSENRLRYELFAQPVYGQDEQTVIQNISDYQVGELLKTRRTFIVDGGMNARVDRQKLRAQAKDFNYETLVVWVQTDEATNRHRSLKRGKQKLDDKYTAPLSEEQFSAQSRKFTPPNQLEQTVVISGKHTYNTQARAVLKKLVAPREEALEASNAHLPPATEPPPRRRHNVHIN
jgi:predicted kinase